MTSQTPGALNVNLQRGGSVLVSARREGTFQIEAHDSNTGSRCAVTLNRSELAALHGALGELIKFHSTND